MTLNITNMNDIFFDTPEEQEAYKRDLILYGNAYARAIKDEAGKILRFEHIPARDVRIELAKNE